MLQKINILCTPDDNYVPYCGIMLTSLFENNKDLDISVYVMCEQLDDKNIVGLKRLSEHYNADIKIIMVNKKAFEKCPIRVGDHVSIAAYYRLIAPNILPGNINKILYLDCDIIVNASIKELYNNNIEDYALGAVIDEDFFNNEKYERLNYNKKFSYYNSGVLLLNLNYWRNNELSIKCLEYISKYPDRVIFHDQDTLNAVCHDKMKLLPLKYNFQKGFLLTQYKYDETTTEEILKYALAPTIIHYTGFSKPWHKNSKHPYTKRFLYYKNISLWYNIKLTDNTSLIEKLRSFFFEIIWSIGIKKRPKSYIIEEQK